MVTPGAPREWDGRRVVLFLGAIMCVVAVALALGPAALNDDVRRSEQKAPPESHQE